MLYKSVVVECSTGTEDLAKAIEKKAEEMMKKGTYKLAAMSTVGTDQAILIFEIQSIAHEIFKFIEQQLSVDISSSVILMVGGHLYPKPLQKAKGTF